jgi:hypothetical protein
LLGHWELEERLTKEVWRRATGDEGLVLQLHPQLLFLSLKKLNLLVELIMKHILGLLLRLQGQFGCVRGTRLSECIVVGLCSSVGSPTTTCKPASGGLIVIPPTTTTTPTSTIG